MTVRNLRDEVEGVKNIMTQNVDDPSLGRELGPPSQQDRGSGSHIRALQDDLTEGGSEVLWKNVKMIVLICVIVFIIVLFIAFATGAIPT